MFFHVQQLLQWQIVQIEVIIWTQKSSNKALNKDHSAIPRDGSAVELVDSCHAILLIITRVSEFNLLLHILLIHFTTEFFYLLLHNILKVTYTKPSQATKRHIQSIINVDQLDKSNLYLYRLEYNNSHLYLFGKTNSIVQYDQIFMVFYQRMIILSFFSTLKMSSSVEVKNMLIKYFRKDKSKTMRL
jgi:hypothetical protein